MRWRLWREAVKNKPLPDIDPVRFECELRQIKSMADHTYNIVLNVPEYALEAVKELIPLVGNMLAVAAIDITDQNDK